jgi:hypothetical protein
VQAGIHDFLWLTFTDDELAPAEAMRSLAREYLQLQ